MYNFDSNSILAAPIKNITKQSVIQGYKYCLIGLTISGIKLILHRLYNEVSEDIIEEITSNNMDYQIAAPEDHRLKFEERSIQMFKNHFVSILH